jgi:hypothetical protein
MDDPHDHARERPRRHLMINDPHDPVAYTDNSGLVVIAMVLAAVSGFIVGVVVGILF